MDTTTLKECIEELETSVIETEELLKKAYIESESMPEPIKSWFVIQLTCRENQLNENRVILEHFKKMYERL